MQNLNDNGSGGCTPSSRRPEAWEQLHDEILAGLFAGEYGKAAVALPDLALTHSNAYRFGYGEGFVDLDEASDADLTRSTEAYKAVMHRLEKKERFHQSMWRWGDWFGLRVEPEKTPAAYPTPELQALLRWCRQPARRRLKTTMGNG